MIKLVPDAVDVFSDWIAQKTLWFVQMWPGKLFLAIVLVGPLTFIPSM